MSGWGAGLGSAATILTSVLSIFNRLFPKPAQPLTDEKTINDEIEKEKQDAKDGQRPTW